MIVGMIHTLLFKKLLELLSCGYVMIYDDYCIVSYYKGLNKYSITFPIKKGIRTIKNIQCCNDSNDVNESGNNDKDLMLFLGPFGNFHGINTTPKMLGQDKVIVTYKNNEKQIYNNDEIIHLTHGVYNPTKIDII
jgi:hypothetical protein